MANDQYSIPWHPLDITQGLAAFDAARQEARKNKRADEYADMERRAINDRAIRESHEETRRKDALDHQRAVEAFTQMPLLMRAAANSFKTTGGPGYAANNPYGVNFDVGHDLPANAEGPELSPQAEEARFAPPAPQEFHPVEQPPMGTLAPGMEGPEQNPAASADRYAMEGPQAAPRVLDAGEEGPQQEQPQPLAIPLIAKAAANSMGFQPGPEGQARLYAQQNGGQRFEVPQQSETTGFGEDYDVLYDHIMNMPGMTPGKALAIVAAKQKADSGETGRNTRANNTIDYHNKNREDQQAFAQGENSQYKLTFDQRKELANIMARAKAAAAGAGPVSPGLARLVGMKEQGATDEEIYSEAAKLHLSQKEVTAPVQNVVKNAAAGERAGQKREALTATDDHGQVIGTWKDANSAKAGAKQIESYHRVDERLNALIKDIESQGSRIISANGSDYQRRLSLAKSVVAALRPFNELSNTTAGAQMEEDIVGAIGTPGHGWLMGANADIIKHLRDEARGQHEAQLGTKLRPGGGSQLAPSLGGPRHAPHSDAIQAKAQRALDDPSAPPEAKEAARKILGL